MSALASGIKSMIYTFRPIKSTENNLRLSYSLSREEYAAGAAVQQRIIHEIGACRKWEKRVKNTIGYYYLGVLIAFFVCFVLNTESYLQLYFLFTTIFLLDLLMRWRIRHLMPQTNLIVFDYCSQKTVKVEAEFGQHNISLAGPAQKQEWDWKLLQHYHNLSDVFVLVFAGLEVLIIPKRAFRSKEEEADWEETVKNKLHEKVD